jgi:hypothetical protein
MFELFAISTDSKPPYSFKVFWRSSITPVAVVFEGIMFLVCAAEDPRYFWLCVVVDGVGSFWRDHQLSLLR